MVHRRHSRKRGGSGTGDKLDLHEGKGGFRIHGVDAAATTVPVGTSINYGTGMTGTQGQPGHLQAGGRSRRRSRHKRSHRHGKKSHRRSRHRGGGMLEAALVPFGLFGLQKYFQKSRTNPVSRMARSARKTMKRVF